MSWDSWRVNERLIRVPDELPNPPAELAFMNCKWTIVEISEKNWNRIDKPNSVVYGETTNVVFRIIKENGQYYYSYMYFTQCYGNYCKYFQDFDSNGNEKDLFVDYVSGTPDFTEAPGIRLMAAVCRLFRSEMLSPTDKYEYCSDVKRFAKDWARHVVLFDCPDLLEALFRYGDIHEEDKADIKAEVVDVSNKLHCSECLSAFDRISSVERAEYFPNPRKKLKKGDIAYPARELCKGRKGFVVPKGKKRRTVIVKLRDGNKYPYYAMDKVDDSDTVIIGNKYVFKDDKSAVHTATSGLRGEVIKAYGAESLKKGLATEIDYTFSDEYHDHVELTVCYKFLSTAYREYLAENYMELPGRIYPITFMIQKNLAALTLLQFPSVASDRFEEAMTVLNQEYHMPIDDIVELYKRVIVSVSDVRSECLRQFTETKLSGFPCYSMGSLFEKVPKDNKEFKEILDSNTMVSYLNEYIPLATAEIILRCDLDNLLSVYLENCSRIKDNIGILRNIADEVKAEKCLQML